MTNKIFTWGYGGRGEGFTELLKIVEDNNIRHIIDVREKAVSTWNPKFNYEYLEQNINNSISNCFYEHAPVLSNTIKDPNKWEPADNGSVAEVMIYLSDMILYSQLDEYNILLLGSTKKAVDCHRSIIAEMLADDVKGEVVHL